MPSKWRKLNNILHRDIGYLCVGLTIIYAVSGIAVNHIDDWNPNYSVKLIHYQIEPIPSKNEFTNEKIMTILEDLGENSRYKSHYFSSPETVEIFVDNNTIKIELSTGKVLQEKLVSRPVFREFNFLHLNHPKKNWTWVADIYAVALFFLAITGMFVLKGKNGIKGRGWWMISIGMLVPLIFLFIYYY